MTSMARGACGGCNAVEPGKNLGTVLAHKRDVECVRQPMLRMAIEHDPVAEHFLQLFPKTVASRADLLHGCKIARERACRAKPDGKEGAFGTCTPTAFVVSSVNQ